MAEHRLDATPRVPESFDPRVTAMVPDGDRPDVAVV
jgi:hypothetical protein